MSHHFKGLSFTGLHVVNSLGCTLKPTYPVRILHVNGSAWESGSLQNDAWIIRNKKWLPAFDLHLMVPRCSGMNAAVWIWWTDGLLSLKRSFFNTGFLWESVNFFLTPAPWYALSSVLQNVQMLGFFTGPVYHIYTAVCCSVKVNFLIFRGAIANHNRCFFPVPKSKLHCGE